MNVLLTSVGRRAYMVKYFKDALGENGQVHVCNSDDKTVAFHYADKFVIFRSKSPENMPQELKEQGIITDYYCFKSKGSEFDSVSNSGDRIAGFSMVGKTVEELNEKHNIAVQKLKVINSQGQDMMRRDLLPVLY